MEATSPRSGKFRRLLIVSPHFPPVNAPDLQRIRQALPYLAQLGWQAEILTVHPEDVESAQDPELAAALPPGLIIHRVRAIPQRLTRLLGFGGLAYRAYRALRKKGDTLLTGGAFDLVFFSTSIFGVLPLGPYWKERHAVPYVVDFQDPWLNEYVTRHQKNAPGGRFKYALAQALARRQESAVVRQAAHVISVSPCYIKDFRRRYPELPPTHFTELPFAGLATDFDHLSTAGITQKVFQPGRGLHWVYAGRGGGDLTFSLQAFFLALKKACETGLIDPQTFHLYFLGTHYATGKQAQKTIEPVAQSCGVAPLVTEITERLPYFTVLQCLQAADALIVPGSQDPAYTASKIYPYILAQRPLLALFHEQSSVVRVLSETKAGTLITFQENSRLENLSREVYEKWFQSGAYRQKPNTDWQALFTL